MGIGSAFGATAMPKLQQKLPIDTRLTSMTIILAGVLLMLGYLTSPFLIYIAMFFIGFCCIVILSTFNIFVQTVVATWVKARAIGVYVLIIQGGMAIGSIIWGIVASHFSIPHTFLFAAIGLIIGLAATFRFPLETKNEIDLTPSFHWQQPVVIHDIATDHGPVLISITYHINPKDMKEFLKAVKKLSHARKRSRALRWGIFKATDDNAQYIENFISDSWGEHLRQHKRITVYDKKVEDTVNAFHKGNKPPVAIHYIAKKML